MHSLNIVCCECPKPHHGSSTQRQDLLCQRPWQRTSDTDKDSGVIFVIPFRCMCSVVPHMCVLVQILLPGALSGLTATLSTLVGELSRSDSEDTLEEQAAELLKLSRKLEDVRAALREAAESPVAGSRPSRCAARLFGALCLPAGLPQMLPTTTFAAL